MAKHSQFTRIRLQGAGDAMLNKRVNTGGSTGNFVYDLELSLLPKGIYNLELVTGAGRIIARKRFVKL